MKTYFLHIVVEFIVHFGLCLAFLADCPSPCTQGGRQYCPPFPCPNVTCANPVIPKGGCCPECPTPDCPHPCWQAGHHYCFPISCAMPPCNNSFIRPGGCCPECPSSDCPFPCTQGGQHFCHPIPCLEPSCNNSVTPPGACCPECPEPDCPNPCIQGGQRFCPPIQCPKPPCDNPTIPLGACCPECLKREIRSKDCPHPCTFNGHKFCGPIPCPAPHPNCTHKFTPPGGCCEICKDDFTTVLPDRTQTDCPHPCLQGGVQYCYQLPCAIPPCVDPMTPKDACCPICPNGPNCRIEGHVFPALQDNLYDGKLCKCFGLTGKCEDIVD